jgi:hypothetical protein
MAITEKSRHELYQRLEKILGPDQATTLMEHLPPVGWADVATKEDLHQLEARLDTRFETLEVRLSGRIDTVGSRLSGRIDSLDAKIDTVESRLLTEIADLRVELHSTLRTSAFLVIGAMASLVVLVSTITSLA